MAADKYRHAEDEYFKLRGQFDAGRISQEQFDEKLRALMQQDAQGRYWMLGADSAKWYFYDGAKWVQGDPYPGAPVPPPLTAAPPLPPPAASLAPSVAPALSIPPASLPKRSLPLVPLLIGLAVVLALGIAAFLIFQNRDRIFVAQSPQQITPILPPTITRAPSPTALILVPTVAPPLITTIPATNVSTAIPPTLMPTQPPLPTAPAVTVIVVTEVPSPTGALPTLLPTATLPPTQPPTVAPTKPLATVTHAPPTNTVIATCPNGICVTNLQFLPVAPKRNQDVTFTATFLNSTGEPKSYNWLILVFRQDQTKGFGESAAYHISIPPGVNSFAITYPVVKGPGGCESFYARAGWKINAFEKYAFPNVSGDPATAHFDVCP